MRRPLALALMSLAMMSPALAGGCTQAEPAPSSAPEAAPEAAPPPAPSPEVDIQAAQAFVHDGGTLDRPSFDPSGLATVSGRVEGDTAPVHAVAVAAGQTLTVEMRTDSSNLYFNVWDVTDTSGAAAFRGEVEDASASLTAVADTTYVIAPFQPRATARRGEAGDYVLTLRRQ